jgi:hypothetical protein
MRTFVRTVATVVRVSTGPVSRVQTREIVARALRPTGRPEQDR